MSEDIGPYKNTPHLLEEVNEYGVSYTPVSLPVIDPEVDLVAELGGRGIHADEGGSLDWLRDSSKWPDATRSTLMHLVEAAEAEGARYAIEFEHTGSDEPVSVDKITISLRGA